MAGGEGRWPRPLVVALTISSGLGWGACEPLDLPLFPVTPDASVPPPPIDVPTLPGSPQRDAGGDASSGPPPPPPQCQPGETACEACVRAAACAAAEVCHPSTGECVLPCPGGAADCPAALVCGPLDVCVQCAADAQCATTDDQPRCDIARGVCVECLTRDDCTDDVFERPACLPGGVCGCASNADCSDGAICELDEAHCELEED
jgi:hypothetical protein